MFSIELIIFYAFAGLAIISASFVVTVRNPVHAALFLVLTFFASSIIWMSLEAEFLAISLVLVYVGAVMVLFLFVVMMLDINIARVREGFVKFLPIGVAFSIMMLILMMTALNTELFTMVLASSPEPKPADYSNTAALGAVLYTEYVFAFEIAAVILLVAIVAAIALTMRKRPETKYQNPTEQIKVKKADRLKIISGMNATSQTGRK